ncbi:transposase [Rickettsia endosymbiont of Urophora cardui]
MSDKPLNFIQVKVLDASGNRKYNRDLWLCVSGQQKDKISGKEVYEYYRQRFDIEHFFKFGKSKLLMDKFQTNDPNKDEDYMLFVMLAYNILYHAQSSVKARKVRAWDKKINSNMLSPSEVYRSMPQIALEEILEKSVSRGIPDHRNIRNNHQVKPFAPVIRKSNKHGKLEITIKSSFDGSNQITKTSFNKKLELPNNISKYKPAILDKIATVFDTLCTQIE